MRYSDPIKVLLQVRRHRAEVEERKLVAILEKIKHSEEQRGVLSEALARITATRLTEIRSVSPNMHHQKMEMESRALWHRCAEFGAEIERLKELSVQQMSVYVSAHQEQEVMERLDQQRSESLEAERRLREQKQNEDLFLARRVANWDTATGET